MGLVISGCLLRNILIMESLVDFKLFFSSIHFEMVLHMDAISNKAFYLTTRPDYSVHFLWPFLPTFPRLFITSCRNQPVVVIPDISQVDCTLLLTYTWMFEGKLRKEQRKRTGEVLVVSNLEDIKMDGCCSRKLNNYLRILSVSFKVMVFVLCHVFFFLEKKRLWRR